MALTKIGSNALKDSTKTVLSESFAEPSAISGSYLGQAVVSSSAQIAADISGSSFKGTAGTETVFSGSAASTGSFGRVEVNGIGPIGGWMKLQTETSGTQIDFDKGIGSTYDFYKIVCSNVHVSADGADINLRYGYGSPSIAYQTGANYRYAAYRIASNTLRTFYENDGDATSILMIKDIGNLAGEMCDFVLYFQAPSGSTNYNNCRWEGSWHLSDDTKVVHGYGTGTYDDDTDPVTGMRIYPSSGTLTGTFTSYGLTK